MNVVVVSVFHLIKLTFNRLMYHFLKIVSWMRTFWRKRLKVMCNNFFLGHEMTVLQTPYTISYVRFLFPKIQWTKDETWESLTRIFAFGILISTETTPLLLDFLRIPTAIFILLLAKQKWTEFQKSTAENFLFCNREPTIHGLGLSDIKPTVRS